MSGGDKCYYFNCNKTRKTSNNVFHLIPSSNPEIYRKWIINSDETYVVKSPRAWTWSVSKLGVNEGNTQILSEDVCVNETINMTPTKSQRRTNKMDEKNASSTPENLKVVMPNYTYNNLHSKTSTPNISIFNQSPKLLGISPSTKKWVSQLIDLPSPQKPSDRSNNEIINSPRKIAAKNNILQKKLQNMKKLIKHKRAIITSLKKTNEKNKLKQINVHRFFEETKFPSINSKALISMQLLHKRRKPWSKTEKNMAPSLYYKSPSTYKFMRKNGIILPGETTVRRWLNSISFSTEFPKAYMDQIRLKISGMSENEKKCTILLDEVAIMKSLEYNKVLDEIEGYEDLGTLGRTNKIGSQALVVMVRGLYSNWKFPF
ncbi:uncharacterized protein LOC132932707 [Metopolophium dirhodum]|uniref:uncharacterized protein LOC132932707 n=1 Tax=Metopolophium dirhodum TaxID=44670 RepID=UPI00298F9CA6|nr:uncharacterized protein LOC132932707 [Metopolophium dirhodum]